MGRRNRERKERIKAGLELAISQTVKLIPPSPMPEKEQCLLKCLLCGNLILSSDVRRHIKDCWKVDLPLGEQVPFFRDGNKAQLQTWIAQRRLLQRTEAK